MPENPRCEYIYRKGGTADAVLNRLNRQLLKTLHHDTYVTITITIGRVV